MSDNVQSKRAIVVLSNVSDVDSARAIGRSLVESRLAACVSYMPHVHSIYRWKDAIEEAGEVTLVIKTTTDRYAEMENLLRRIHPYELPEIIALPIENGLSTYLKWIEQEVKKDEIK